MRMAFGLVSVLVTIGIIILVMSMMLDQTTGSIPIGLRAQDEARQISGRGQDGEAATSSAFFDAETSGGRLRKLTVVKVVAGGAYDTYFGLQAGDEVVEIEQAGNMMKLHEPGIGNDAELAKALISDAYARQQRIVVIRNGERLTLPLPPGPAVAAAGAPVAGAAATTGPAAPANSTNAPADAGDTGGTPLSRQLDRIKNAGGVN